MNAGMSDGARRVRISTWPVVALALLGLLALIAASILAAHGKARDAYTQLDDLNTRHREVERRLWTLRSDLHLSGILIRDYLLDTDAPALDYQVPLGDLQRESEQMIHQLK